MTSAAYRTRSPDSEGPQRRAAPAPRPSSRGSDPYRALWGAPEALAGGECAGRVSDMSASSSQSMAGPAPTKSASSIADAFDARADRYDESEMHHWLAREAAAAAGASSAARVLDVAGGTGLAARATGSHRAVVLDASVGMLAAARRAGVPGSVRGDAHSLPFRSQMFDAVLCVAALFYLADPVSAACEWHRVCAPGGCAVVTAWRTDGISYPRLLRVAAAEHGVAERDPNAEYGDERRLTHLLSAAGFSKIHVVTRELTLPGGDADLVWRATVGYGLAPALSAAPAAIQEKVRQRFLELVVGAPAKFTALVARGVRPPETPCD